MTDLPTKVEIGAAKIKSGWLALDHKKNTVGGAKKQFDIMFDELPVPDGHLEYCYMSNVLEHIPMPKLRPVLRHICRKLQIGGVLRVAVPDLKQAAEAYVNGDTRFFETAAPAISKDHKTLGVGGAFMCTVVSPGGDTHLYDITRRQYIGGYAHLMCFDIQMLTQLGFECGFSQVSQTGRKDIDYGNEIGQLYAEFVK